MLHSLVIESLQSNVICYECYTLRRLLVLRKVHQYSPAPQQTVSSPIKDSVGRSRMVEINMPQLATRKTAGTRGKNRSTAGSFRQFGRFRSLKIPAVASAAKRTSM